MAFVEQARPLLGAPFRTMGVRDLLVNGVFLQATKKG